MFTVYKSVIVITISIIQEWRKDCGDAHFQYDLGAIKRTRQNWTNKATLVQIWFFFFKTTLKFEDSMMLVTLFETWMWIKRWNLWRRCATQCDAIQVRRCNFIQHWNLGGVTIVETSSLSVQARICKFCMKKIFFPWSFIIVDSKYLHIYFLCAGSQMKYVVCYCTYFAMYIFP